MLLNSQFNVDSTLPYTTLDHETKGALIRNYRALYDYLWELSWKEEDILEELIKNHKQGTPNKGINLRKQYPVQFLEYYFEGWCEFASKKQSDILWYLGINNKDLQMGVLKGLYHSIHDNSLQYGDIIYGQERTDGDWINNRVGGYAVASIDAMVMGSIYKWGYDFRGDLPQVAPRGGEV